MRSDGFSTVLYCQIASSNDRDLRLEDRPAVYAWYRNIRVDPLLAPDEFVKTIRSLLSVQLSPSHTTVMGFLYHVTVAEEGGELNDGTSTTLARIASSPQARMELALILEKAASLQAPLYVGKTMALRRRVGEHVTGTNSELRSLLEAARIRMDQCLLKFRYVDPIDSVVRAVKTPDLTSAEASDAICVLIEELLTRLGPAAFVRRPG